MRRTIPIASRPTPVRLADGRDDERFFFQPCFSPVWDTAIAHSRWAKPASRRRPALNRAADWLLTKEVRRKGDWSVKRPDIEPSGWASSSPTSSIPISTTRRWCCWRLLHAAALERATRRTPARTRAVNWLLAMQSKDGGWAAFDVDNNWELLSNVPFADHNAMLDPTCPDITGRVLEALCAYGLDREHPAVRRGVEYLIRTQEQDGSWYGRWGVELHLRHVSSRCADCAPPAKRPRGAHSARRRMAALDSECRRRLGRELRQLSNELLCAGAEHSLADRLGGPGTAWPAAIGTSISLQKGIEWLIEKQTADGTWNETLSTGTGFPQVFYLSYHLYRNSFPLLALAGFLHERTQRAIGRWQPGETGFGDRRDRICRLAYGQVIKGARTYSSRSGS